MKLVLMRHAEAQDRERYSELHAEDSLRPLTEKGYRRMLKAARGLRQILPELALIATSPYTRSTQTADVISSVYGSLPIVRKDALAPGGSIQEMIEWLRLCPQDQTILLIGHEPSLSLLGCELLSGHEHIFVSLPKGSAMLIDFHDSVAIGGGLLSWMLLSKHLRQIRNKK